MVNKYNNSKHRELMHIIIWFSKSPDNNYVSYKKKDSFGLQCQKAITIILKLRKRLIGLESRLILKNKLKIKNLEIA